LKNGPCTPGGSVPRISPSFLRTWYQTCWISRGGDESFSWTMISTSPGLE
jgi:hypothetical protein